MLCARRNLMADKALPYDAEVKCLKSSGHQYIKTDYVMRSSCVEAQADVRYRLDGVITPNSYLFGCLTSFCSPSLQITGGANYACPAISDKYTYTNYAMGIWSNSNNNVYDVVIEANNSTKAATCYRNGSKFGSGSFSSDIAPQIPFFVFCINSNSSPGSSPIFSLFHLYMAEDGVEKLHLIPVVKNGVGFLYDSVSNALYGNSGTGSFGWEELDGTVVPPQ